MILSSKTGHQRSVPWALRQRPPVAFRCSSVLCQATSSTQSELVNSQGNPVTDSEAESMQDFKAKYSMLSGEELFPAAVGVLKEAIRDGSPANEIVEGAMVFLDTAAAQRNLPEGYLDKLDSILESEFRIVFSTLTSFKPFQYLPAAIKEDFVFSRGEPKQVSLVTPLGPLCFTFTGSYSIQGDNEIQFQFQQSKIDFLGNVVRDSSMSGKQKTYTYVTIKDGIAVVRSSGGGLTLSVLKSQLKPKEWKPDFLATNL